MGGTWEGEQDFDLSSEGSLDIADLSPTQSAKNPNKSRPSTYEIFEDKQERGSF